MPSQQPAEAEAIPSFQCSCGITIPFAKFFDLKVNTKNCKVTGVIDIASFVCSSCGKQYVSPHIVDLLSTSFKENHVTAEDVAFFKNLGHRIEVPKELAGVPLAVKRCDNCQNTLGVAVIFSGNCKSANVQTGPVVFILLASCGDDFIPGCSKTHFLITAPIYPSTSSLQANNKRD